MEITIQYTGQLAGLTGVSEEPIEINAGATLREVVATLCQRHGEAYTEMLLEENGKLRPSLLVIFDGEQADGDVENQGLEGVKTVMLMTPIAGG